MKVKAIIAHDQNYGMGYKGKLPWKNRRELAFFKVTTAKSVIIVGHNTALTLPYLPGRLVIVPTNNPEPVGDSNVHRLTPEMVRLLVSDSAAFNSYLDQHGPRLNRTELFIAGGPKTLRVYEDFIQAWHISLIQGVHDADTFFDPSLLDNFQLSDMREFLTFIHLYYTQK